MLGDGVEIGAQAVEHQLRKGSPALRSLRVVAATCSSARSDLALDERLQQAGEIAEVLVDDRARDSRRRATDWIEIA